MKKTLLTLCAVAMVCFLASGALAYTYTFPNNTEVKAYLGNEPAPSGSLYVGWHDLLGGPEFEVYGADLNDKTLSIYTNLPSTGPASPSIANLADLFIDVGCDKTWDLAIKMSGTNIGKVYLIDATSDYRTSQQVWKDDPSGTIYGGRYDANNVTGDPRDPQPVPVIIRTANATLLPAITAVSWNTPSGKDGIYRIDITGFGDLVPSGQPYGFLWGSGDCANDTAQGCVPLPGAVLLLGSGLVILAAYARRRRQV